MLGALIKEGIQNVDDIRMRMNASIAGMLLALGLCTSKLGIGSALSFAINCPLHGAQVMGVHHPAPLRAGVRGQRAR